MTDPVQHVEQLNSLAQSKAFLGREFLTWLWYVAETTDARMAVPSRSEDIKELEFDLWVDDRLVLESSAAMAHENVMKGGDPSRSTEASAALSVGKTVKEMKIGVNVQGFGEYTAVLHCDDLNPRSLKLPKNEDAATKEASQEDLPLLVRLRQAEIFLTVVDGLFAQFLKARTEPSWEERGLKDVRGWIRARSDKVATKLH